MTYLYFRGTSATNILPAKSLGNTLYDHQEGLQNATQCSFGVLENLQTQTEQLHLNCRPNSLKRDHFVNSVNLQKTRHVSKNNELIGLKQRLFSGNNRICPNYDSPDFKNADIPIQRQFQVFVQNNHVFLNRS